MNETKKKELYAEEKKHLEKVKTDILDSEKKTETSIRRIRTDLMKQVGDTEYLIELLIQHLETQKQLEYSSKSPYFVRCDVEFNHEKGVKTFYFGRFPFRDDFIYSWVASAASIRFESPGNFSYTLPNGEQVTGRLLRKDQFMIVNNKILFMSNETTEYPRELIYQEYFSDRKDQFMLPEIVKQMEKAQDTIIRSHYFGSFLISGAAGSGKTTLALHRVAYLVQLPETEELFKPSTIHVFVQDASTKKYFSSLLPELGIYRVVISTFDEWALKVLEITDMQFVKRFGKTEVEKDTYEFRKNQALYSLNKNISEKHAEKILKKVYADFFSDKEEELFKTQMDKKVLDRFDLTILMLVKLSQEKILIEKVDKYKKKNDGRYIKKLIKQPLKYSLIVLDEAENYLKEQIQILNTCINPETKAMIYVGDLVQQTLLWTVKDWEEVNEKFLEDRRVILQKVYRNTKQILDYIYNLGFPINTPQNIKEGKAVTEKTFPSKQEEITYTKKLLSEIDDKTIGIIAKTDEYLLDYKREFSSNDNIHVMTINEAQGVEFEAVILVGINKELYKTDSLHEDIMKERKKVNRDLLYVALTRAMNEL